MTPDAAPWREGDVLPTRAFGPLTRTDFVRYQGASGDFNPIHHDEGFARSAGFPTVFGVGMLHAALLSSYCTDLFGPRNVRRVAVQFRAQVWPDDVLTCSGTVAGLSEQDGEPRVDLSLVVTRQTGEPAVIGEATFALP
jgi:acyl dehydratase